MEKYQNKKRPKVDEHQRCYNKKKIAWWVEQYIRQRKVTKVDYEGKDKGVLAQDWYNRILCTIG